jgi:hypothetical protein
VLIPDDGRKAETCVKSMVYGMTMQIIVLTEPNTVERRLFELISEKDGSNNRKFG